MAGFPDGWRVKWTGWYAKGSGVGELRAGDRGRDDVGPAYCDTKPSFFLSLTDIVGTGDQKRIRLAQWLNERCCVGWELIDEAGDLDPISTASIQFSLALDGSNNIADDYQFLTFREGGEGGTVKFGLKIRKQNVFTYPVDYGRAYISNSVGGVASGFSTLGANPYRVTSPTVHRYQITVVGTTVTVTAYNDGVSTTTPRFTLTATIADPVFDTIEFGVREDTNSLGVVAPPITIRNLFVYDTNQAPFGPYTDTDAWSYYADSVETPLTLEGSTVDESPVAVTWRNREVVQGAHTAHLDIPMGEGTGNLFVPLGPPPPTGWRVALWGYSGFFVSGSRNAIIERWVRDLLANGTAVLAVGYRPASYSTGVHWPELLYDYKSAGKWVDDNAATYDLDPARKYATGYSAGGNLALMSVLTEGVTDDGSTSNRDLTIPGGDPSFAGAFVYAAPVDLQTTEANDPIPDVILSAMRTLTNTPSGAIDYSGLKAQEYIASNDLQVPIGYVRGRWDELVGQEQPDALVSAAAATGKSALISMYQVRADHDSIDDRYDSTPIPAPTGSQQFIDWVTAVEAA